MEHRFEPSKYYLTFGPNEPAYHIKSGDIVVSSTVDARGYDSLGTAVPEEAKQHSSETLYDTSNPLIGPFYVEEAELGDTLHVRIEDIALNRPNAWSGVLPHFGALTEESSGKCFLLNESLSEKLFQWELDLKRNVGILELPRSRLKRIEIPLHPFLGCIGVAPRYGRIEPALIPGEYGGNMDCVETKKGATLDLPVFVRGAYLAFGDIHAAQGDGEICGVALETTAQVKLSIQLVKGKAIEWPRIEDNDYIMVAASARPLMDAFKIAHYELLNWLVADYGFERMEGLQVISQAGRCRIGNVVDPNYTVVAKLPKKYLP
jgi:acetamidase/formamidase